MGPCDLQFVCGKRWEGLTPIEAASARYCGECRKAVFQVKTKSQLLVSSALGRCVGIADDNDFIGVIGDPGSLGGFDWMEAGYFEGVAVRLAMQPDPARVDQLRLLFPKLFDGGLNEELLRHGEVVNLGELGAPEREQLLQELREFGPELEATA